MKLWTSLLFLHGHIADADLATELAATDATAETGTPRPPVPRPHADRRYWKATAARWLRNLEYLGGRPMTAGHNADIEEPFPHLVAAPARRGARPSQARPKPCSTRRGAIAAVCGTVALSPFR